MNGQFDMEPAVVAGLVVSSLVISLVLYVWAALALARVFSKLGEDGWKAWVPVVNLITVLRLGAVNPLWILSLAVPGLSVVGVVMTIVAAHRINLRFARGTGMTVLAALLPLVWASVLGFGHSVQVGGTPNRAPGTLRDEAARVGVPTAAAPARPQWSPTPVEASAPIVPAPPPPPPPERTAPAVSLASEERVVPPAARDPWAPPATSVPGFDGVPPTQTPGPARSKPASVSPTEGPESALPSAVSVDDFDKTVIARKKKQPAWVILPEGGEPIRVTTTSVVLGRNPQATPDFPDAERVVIPDSSKTVSKTHALLLLTEGVWNITDLSSTNGVYLLPEGVDGEEIELEAGGAAPITGEFRLGDLAIRISPDDRT